MGSKALRKSGWVVLLTLAFTEGLWGQDRPNSGGSLEPGSSEGLYSFTANGEAFFLVAHQIEQLLGGRKVNVANELRHRPVYIVVDNKRPDEILSQICQDLGFRLDIAGNVAQISASATTEGVGGGAPGTKVPADTAAGFTFFPLQNTTVDKATDLLSMLRELEQKDQKAKLIPLPSRNGFAMKGSSSTLDQAKQLMAQFDLPSLMETRVYKLKYYTATGSLSWSRDSVGEVASTTAGSGGELDAGDAEYSFEDILKPFLSGNEASLTIMRTEDLIIVTDYPRNLAMIEEILSHIDRRPRQVLLEVTILQLTLDDQHELGVDFNSLAGIDFNQLFNGAGQGTAGTVGSPTDFSTLSTDPGQAASLVDDGFGSAGTSFPTTNTQGLQIGFIKNKVGAFIQAVETVGEVSVTANPKILGIDRHRSEIHIGDKLSYKAASVTNTGGSAGGSATITESVEELETGIKLTFTPFIADNGYVRLLLSPKRSSGEINAAGLPEENVAEISVNAIVRSGRTIVIGGLMEEVQTNNQVQVPFLGDIPLLGRLFKRETGGIRKNEVIFLVTPYIINDEDMEELSLKVWAEMETKRQEFESHIWLGNRMRRSYMWLGSDGSPRDTNWIARTEWALALNPLHSTALKVRDEILIRDGEPTMREEFETKLDLMLPLPQGYASLPTDEGYEGRRLFQDLPKDWNPELWAKPVVAESTATASTPQPTDKPSEGPAKPVIPPYAQPMTPWWAPTASQRSLADNASLPVAVKNGVGMQFVLVPADTFRMGSPLSEPGRQDNEGLHLVRLTKPMYVGAHEVTLGDWAQVMGFIPPEHSDRSVKLPMERTTWFDAVVFCNKLSERDGLPPCYEVSDIRYEGAPTSISSATVKRLEDKGGYRLLSEAEWEYACRANSSKAFAFGDSLGVQAAINNGSRDRVSAPVGSFACNAFGIYDMHGNVYEWCWDWYGVLGSGEVTDPTGPEKGDNRVFRGGSFIFNAQDARSAARQSFAPNLIEEHVGFRIARTVVEGSKP